MTRKEVKYSSTGNNEEFPQIKLESLEGLNIQESAETRESTEAIQKELNSLWLEVNDSLRKSLYLFGPDERNIKNKVIKLQETINKIYAQKNPLTIDWKYWPQSEKFHEYALMLVDGTAQEAVNSFRDSYKNNSDKVKQLQRAINAMNWSADLTEDWKYWPKTGDAFSSLRSRLGWTVSGNINIWIWVNSQAPVQTKVQTPTQIQTPEKAEPFLEGWEIGLLKERYPHTLDRDDKRRYDSILRRVRKAGLTKEQAIAWETPASIAAKRTMEHSWIETWNIFWARYSREKWMNDLNVWSIEAILENEKWANMFEEVDARFKANPSSSYHRANTGGLIKIYESYGYTPKWSWDLLWHEQVSLYALMKEINFAQGKMRNAKWRDKMWVVLDFDSNTILTNDFHFYVRELQVFKWTKTKQQFTNLLKNIWYKSYDEFNNKMNSNYYGARADFIRRLWVVLAGDFLKNPAQLLQAGSVKTSFNRLPQIQNQVTKTLANNPRYQKAKKEDPEFAARIESTTVWIVLGAMTWVWVQKDINKITNWLIDNAWVWYVNWQLWLVLWKSLTDRVSIATWLSWFVPFVWVWWTLKKWDLNKFTNLFPTNFSWWLQVSAWVSYSKWWVGAWLDFQNIDENTRDWMFGAVEKMWTILDWTFEAISKWTSFKAYAKQSGVESNPKNKNIYEAIAWIYKSSWSNKSAIPYIKEWILNNYLRELYKNAEWWHFGSISFGMIWPIIWIGASIDTHSTKWVQVNKSVETITESFNADLDSYSAEAVESTKEINSNISSFIIASKTKDKDALRSSHTPWMTKLQSLIHDYINWRWGLNLAWDQAIRVFTHEKIDEYARLNWKTQELANIRYMIRNVRNSSEKNLVLQNIAMNLMKKSQIDVIGKTVELKDWFTVQEYDKEYNRAAFFNGIFKAQFPDLDQAALNKARNEYMRVNGDARSYGVWIMEASDWISFSGVQVGKRTWVNAYVAWGHIAKFDGWVDKVEINAKSDYVVNKLPIYVLKSLWSQMIESWLTGIETIDDVREVIKNWWRDWFTISYKLYFAKDPECLNDKIIIDLDIQWQRKTEWWDRAKPKHRSNRLWIFFTHDTTKPDRPEIPPTEDDKSDTIPNEEELEIPDITEETGDPNVATNPNVENAGETWKGGKNDNVSTGTQTNVVNDSANLVDGSATSSAEVAAATNQSNELLNNASSTNNPKWTNASR